MVPRPRSPANKGLLRRICTMTRAARPIATDGKWFQFGTDRIKAIDAAKQLNLEFMHGADLVGTVLNNTSETFAGFLDTYERDVLPPRELAKGTLGPYAVHFRRFRKQFEGKAVDQITIRMIAEMLDALTPRTANRCRALLIDIFNHAAVKGLCPDNPAASTINRIEKKQRKRHTVEGLKAIREKAPVWFQNAIDLALITAQRRTDILDMRFDGVRDGYLYLVRRKRRKPVTRRGFAFA